MLKHFLPTLIAILISIQSFGQANTVKSEISEAQKKRYFSGVIGVVGEDSEGYYVLRTKSQGFFLAFIPIGVKIKLYLDYYSHDMKLLKSTIMEGITIKTYGRTKNSYEFCAQDQNENLYVFYSKRLDGHTVLLKSKLNKSTFRFEKPEKISKLRNEKKRGRQGSFELLRSDDENKYAIVSVSKSSNKDQTNINIDYLDKDFNKVSSKEEVLRFNINDIRGKGDKGNSNGDRKSVSDMKLSNAGDLILLATTVRENKFFKATIFDFHLVSVSENKNQASYKKINFEGNVPISATIANSNTKSGELRCLGFYSTEKNYAVDGIYSVDFNPENLDIKETDFKKFNSQQIEDFLVSETKPNEKVRRRDRRIRKRIAKNKEVKIKSFFIREQYVFDDQSYTLVAEEYYITTSTTRDANGNMTTTTYYHYNDLVYIHINKSGNIEWVKNVNKSQVSSSPVNLGTYNFENETYIYSLYNDFSEKRIVLTSISKSGDVAFKTIGELRRRSELGKYPAKIYSFRLVEKNEVIGFANRSRKGKMIRLKL